MCDTLTGYLREGFKEARVVFLQSNPKYYNIHIILNKIPLRLRYAYYYLPCERDAPEAAMSCIPDF